MADIPAYPLYNTSYALFRLSPLHHPDAPLLAARALDAHAHRLRDQLKGDSVRGVDVSYAAADDAARLGPLAECSWDLIGDEDAWIDRHRQLVDPDASHVATVVSPDDARGIDVRLEYENQSCRALLLRAPGTPSAPSRFTSLPLLLVKMPASIRHVFLDYLRTSFDAHLAPLKLSSAFLTDALETFFRHLTASSSTMSIQDVIRQLQIQLSFPLVTNSLKHIELTIAANDVPGFVSCGKQLSASHEKPFTAALSSYLKKHLALDLSHPKAHITRLSCNSFHLGTDRLKLAAPDILADTSVSDTEGPDASAAQLAVYDFFTSLVREAAGSGKFLSSHNKSSIEDKSSTPSSTTSAEMKRRKRAVSTTTAATGATVKRSKAKGTGNEREAGGDDQMTDV